MKRKILVAVGVLAAVVLVAGALFAVVFLGPSYEPGQVRSAESLRDPLDPPPGASDAEYWQVTPDIRLYHFARGQGDPVLVLHGGPGFPTAAAWQGLEQFEGEYRFHYYHQRGCGRSTRPIERFESDSYMANRRELIGALGLAAHIADIERIRRLLGTDRLTLIGHSFGGFIAAMYAAEFPERVRALVLVAPAPMVVFPGDDDANLFGQIRDLLPENRLADYDAFTDELFDYGALFDKDEQALSALNARIVHFYRLALKNRPEARQSSQDGPASGGLEGVGGWIQPGIFMSMGLVHDYSEALASIRAPVLILHGADDLQPERVTRVYGDYFAHSEFRVIAGAGHFVCHEQPAACAEAVGQFLRADPGPDQ
jgi:proline iminopeptidase